jgi:hypothetical protein
VFNFDFLLCSPVKCTFGTNCNATFDFDKLDSHLQTIHGLELEPEADRRSLLHTGWTSQFESTGPGNTSIGQDICISSACLLISLAYWILFFVTVSHTSCKLMQLAVDGRKFIFQENITTRLVVWSVRGFYETPNDDLKYGYCVTVFGKNVSYTLPCSQK